MKKVDNRPTAIIHSLFIVSQRLFPQRRLRRRQPGDVVQAIV
jgi:hypothetical protein